MSTCKFCGKEVNPGEFDMLFTKEALKNMPCNTECKNAVLNKINLLEKLSELRAERIEMEKAADYLETIEYYMIVAQINACMDQVERIEILEINAKPPLKWEL